MQKIVGGLILLLFQTVANGQQTYTPTAAYLQQTGRATSLLQAENYPAAAKCYDSAFDASCGAGIIYDKYNAACAWSKAGNPAKAFHYLSKMITEDKFDDTATLRKDPDLFPLHGNASWLPTIKAAEKNYAAKSAQYNLPLKALLEAVYENDQGRRMTLDSINARYGPGSAEAGLIWQKIRLQDSLDLVQVKRILDEQGWPGPAEVGEKACSAVFLVIQHSDSLTMETCLPKMREAVISGKAKKQDLALLEDRVLTLKGKPQLYGSQLQYNNDKKSYEFLPIYDEPNVNKRRFDMGLGPIEEYAKFFNVEYKPAAMKK